MDVRNLYWHFLSREVGKLNKRKHFEKKWNWMPGTCIIILWRSLGSGYECFVGI